MRVPVPLRMLARGVYARFRYLTLCEYIFFLIRKGRIGEAHRLGRHRDRMYDIIYATK